MHEDLQLLYGFFSNTAPSDEKKKSTATTFTPTVSMQNAEPLCSSSDFMAKTYGTIIPSFTDK